MLGTGACLPLAAGLCPLPARWEVPGALQLSPGGTSRWEWPGHLPLRGDWWVEAFLLRVSLAVGENTAASGTDSSVSNDQCLLPSAEPGRVGQEVRRA